MLRSAPILALLLVFIVAIVGVRGLTPNASYRVYFDESDPAMQNQSRFETEFSRQDALLLIVTPPHTDSAQPVLDQPNDKYQQFAEALLALPQITAVRGLNDFYDTGHPDVRKLLQQQYVASGADTGLIELDVELNDKKSADELNEVAARIITIAADALPTQTNIEFGGPLALNMAYSDVIKHDLRVFIPGLILLTGLVLYLALGHLGLSVALIVLGAIAVAVASGIAGWLRFEVAAINAFGPVVIVGLSLATQIHLVLACVRHLNQGKPIVDAVTDGMAECRWPFSMSCITTAAGFAALLLSPSPPVQKLGLIVAFGLIAIYLLGLIVLPQLLRQLNLASLATRYARWQQRLNTLAQILHDSRQWIIALFALALLITLPPLLNLKINDFVYGYFPAEHSFTKSIATLNDDYSGAVQLHYKIDSGATDGVFGRDYLASTQSWIDWLRQQPEVKSVSNLTELIERSLLPDELKKQYVQTTALNRLTNADFSAQAITLSLHSITANELLAFDERVTARFADQFDTQTSGIGADLVFAKLGYRNAASMFATLALALVAISVLLGIVFRSLTLCLVGLVCNAVPLIIVYGIWSITGGYISLGSAVVMGMIMGIIVDDSVHMLYRYHFTKTSEPNAATSNKVTLETRWVAHMLADTGPALLVSSIALIAGLAVGLFSSFRPVKELAMLSMAVIFLATITDLILLPALLNFLRKKSKS